MSKPDLLYWAPGFYLVTLNDATCAIQEVSLAIFVLKIYGQLCKFVRERWQQVLSELSVNSIQAFQAIGWEIIPRQSAKCARCVLMKREFHFQSIPPVRRFSALVPTLKSMCVAVQNDPCEHTEGIFPRSLLNVRIAPRTLKISFKEAELERHEQKLHFFFFLNMRKTASVKRYYLQNQLCASPKWISQTCDSNDCEDPVHFGNS